MTQGHREQISIGGEAILSTTGQVHIIKQSDPCNKFFHDLVKWNNKWNSLVAITKALGEKTTSIHEVAEEFVSHFERLLCTNVICSPLDSNPPAG